MFVKSAISASSAFATYAATTPMPIAIAEMTRTRRPVVKSPSSCMQTPTCLSDSGFLEEHARPAFRQRHPLDQAMERSGKPGTLGGRHRIHGGDEPFLGGTGRAHQPCASAGRQPDLRAARIASSGGSFDEPLLREPR